MNTAAYVNACCKQGKTSKEDEVEINVFFTYSPRGRDQVANLSASKLAKDDTIRLNSWPST